MGIKLFEANSSKQYTIEQANKLSINCFSPENAQFLHLKKISL